MILDEKERQVKTMCSSPKVPKQELPPPPVRVENYSQADQTAETKNAMRRRQRMALSRRSMAAGGAMQGSSAGADGKNRLGE